MNFIRKNFIISVAIALTLANVMVWYVVIAERRGEMMTVAFLDIGQGDSIYIEAPNGNQIIFDGGPNGKILSELGKILPFYDRSIDAIVVTNPDKDHFAGFIDVLDRYKVEKFFETGTKNKTSVYAELEKAVKKEGAEKIIATRGMKFVLDQERNIYIEVLFPETVDAAKNSNDGSLVARLIYGQTAVMLTGDATKKVEDRVVELAETVASVVPGNAVSGVVSESDENILKSDILKVGHHGSKTSTGENFIKKVLPRYAVISSGRNNKYGHPNEETLDTLKKFDVNILRTDERGTIVMRSDGKSLHLK